MADLATNDVCQYELRAYGLAFQWNPIKGSLPLHYKSLVGDLIEVRVVHMELQ